VVVLRKLSLKIPDWKEAHLSRLRVEEVDGGLLVRLRVEAPSGVIRMEDRRIISEALSEHFGEKVEVRINLLEYRRLEASEQEGG
jgi:hypothetical protein